MDWKRVVRLGVVCLCVGILSGCGQKTEKATPQAKSVGSVDGQAKSTASSARTVRRTGTKAMRPAPAPEAALEEAGVTVRLCALTGSNERGLKAGLVNRQTGSTAVVGIGQSFEGYELVNADREKEQVTVRKGGREYVLRLTAGEGQSATASVAHPQPNGSGEAPAIGTPGFVVPPEGLDLSKIKPPHFDPTPEEKEKGIDPNDPKTWPVGYRGPGIERAMRSAPASQPGPVLSARPDTRLEPTPEEKEKGIDPNDPKTWPAGYRGPGIERALKEHPELMQQKGPVLTAPTTGEGAAPGKGPGIEEALMRMRAGMPTNAP